jgi:microcin C transport system permease protein
MGAYLIRRLILVIPTLLGIMLINFFVIQVVPGGPVEQLIAQLSGTAVEATARVAGGGTGDTLSARQDTQNLGTSSQGVSKYRGARGLDPQIIKEIEVMYGLDKPLHVRFLEMMQDYLTFDFGDSFYQDRRVIDIVLEKMPVSISLGLWTTLLVYVISIPLGITKAVRDGTRFDVTTSSLITVGYAVPNFLFALLLIIVFAGGRYFSWFPLRGLVSVYWHELSLWGKILDYLWHMVLPIVAMVISGFATLTLLTKNSFLDQIQMQYVMTARAKGLGERRVLYGHVFRNAMLILIASFPGTFITAFFTGSLLIETIFSLDGLGLLGFESVVNRDYPVVFATAYIFGLLALLIGLLSDLTYTWVDPRIDFESREL